MGEHNDKNTLGNCLMYNLFWLLCFLLNQSISKNHSILEILNSTESLILGNSHIYNNNNVLKILMRNFSYYITFGYFEKFSSKNGRKFFEEIKKDIAILIENKEINYKKINKNKNKTELRFNIGENCKKNNDCYSGSCINGYCTHLENEIKKINKYTSN